MAGIGTIGSPGSTSVNSKTLARGGSGPVKSSADQLADNMAADALNDYTQGRMNVRSNTTAGASGGGGYADILKALGGAFGGSGGAATPGAAMTNTSTPNPTIDEINKLQLDRAKGDMNAANLGRQSDIAIRDNAENERKAAGERSSNRGISGGGYDDAAQAGITRDTLSQQTKARVGIANDAESRRDALYGQVAGQAATSEELQNSQRNIGINQALANSQIQTAANNQQMQALQTVMNFIGGSGGIKGL